MIWLFDFDFLGIYDYDIAMYLRDFGLLNSVETMIDYGDLRSWTECTSVL